MSVVWIDSTVVVAAVMFILVWLTCSCSVVKARWTGAWIIQSTFVSCRKVGAGFVDMWLVSTFVMIG